MTTPIAYKGEVGRVISQTTGVDWTGATAKQIKVRRPDATTFTKSGADVVVDDAATGQVHFVTVGGATPDLSVAGQYLMQAMVTISTVILYGPLTSFYVEEVL